MKPKEVPVIIVDVHEATSGILKRLQEKYPDAREEHLETSDISIIGNGHHAGLEIKRLSDMAHSLYSGRLHDQVARLQMHPFTFSMLIIEGWRPYVDFGFEGDLDEYLEGAMSKHIKTIRSFNRKIITTETKDMDDTLSLIDGVISDIKKDKLTTLRRKPTIIALNDPQTAILASIPYVGIVKAEELLKRYGTPGNALNRVDEWIEISGITEERLKEIKIIWG